MNKQISKILLSRVINQLEAYIDSVYKELFKDDADSYTEDIKRDLKALKDIYYEQN